MSPSSVLRVVGLGVYEFWCPGCKSTHMVDDGWIYTGTPSKPTFLPSILVRSGHYAPNRRDPNRCWCTYNAEHPDEKVVFTCLQCHSFVTDGRIKFLDDCSHDLAGQTVNLQPFPEQRRMIEHE